ncbi:MAG: OmpA family protein [Labilithrix sp.]|nr:OmpA family protein [Labilithrix sp.]MCW5814050.1 OmpA family protein [Labilithrix sp.]
MSKKVIFPLMAVFALSVGVGSLGCQAEAKIGNAEPKAATPPPPEPPPPPASTPAPEPPPPAPIKSTGKAKVEGDTIKIPGKIHFKVNSAVIEEDKETKEILQTVADVLKENTQITKLHIEGHTDADGGHDHNQKLSQDRADAVAKWLTEKGGVDKGRLDPKGWGEERPLAKNDTPANKETNRRVEFKIWEINGKPTDAQKNDAAPPAAK